MKHKKRIFLYVTLIVLFSMGIASFAASIVRATFVHAVANLSAVSVAQKDIEVVRATLTDQVRALMRYARSSRTYDLVLFESHNFQGAVTVAILGVQCADADAAVGQLQRSLLYHDAWISRMQKRFHGDPHVMSPPLANAPKKRLHQGRILLEDMERTTAAIDEQLNEVDVMLSDEAKNANAKVVAQLPEDVAAFAFVAAALAAAGTMAVIYSHRFFAERMRSHQLASAFGHMPLVQSPLVALDAILAPFSADDMVGGDWYDTCALPDGRIFLVVGDVRGHGIEAALTMMQVRRALLAAAIGLYDPALVLRSVNKAYADGQLLSVSAICAYYEPTRHCLRYASAGFPAPIVRDRNGTRLLGYGGPPLGADSEYPYESHTELLGPGDIVAFYTDGLIEADHDSVNGENFLCTEANRIDVQNFAHGLYDALFSAQTQCDDVAILSLYAVQS